MRWSVSTDPHLGPGESEGLGNRVTQILALTTKHFCLTVDLPRYKIIHEKSIYFWFNKCLKACKILFSRLSTQK